MTLGPGDSTRARMRVYAPNGALTGSLPYPLSWEMAVPLNDMPSLTLTYMRGQSGGDLLSVPCEVAVEMNDSTDPPTVTDQQYTEYAGCRFLNLRQAWDASDQTQTVSYTMPGYGWQLKKVRFADVTKLNDDGQRVFTGASVGAIMKAIIDESKGRGNIPGLTYSFTATTDTAGVAWPNTFDITFDGGQDAWSILDAMTRQGQCDWRFNGRALEIYKAETFLARDQTASNTIAFHPYVSTMGEPTEATLEDLASSIVVVGDKRNVIVVNSPSSLQPWGKWEEVVRASGVSNTGMLQILAQRTLEVRSQARTQMSKDMVFRNGNPVPLSVVRPGDLVRARDAVTGSQTDGLRIYQITVASDDERGLKWSMMLNDRFADRLVKYEKWVNSVTGTGGPGNGDGSGGVVTPPVDIPDQVGNKPLPPTGLVVTATSYIDELGNPVGLAKVNFNQVTTDVTGQPITPDRYQVGWRISSLPAGTELQQSVKHPATEIYVDALEGGKEYRFFVFAISQTGKVSDASGSVLITIPLSSVPPPTPSTPILSTKLGTVKVTWDGNTSLGTAMPKDFTMVRVEMSTTGGAPWARIGEIYQANSSVISTNNPVGSTRWYRFVSVNSSFLSSISPSAVASIVVLGVSGPDIEANSITSNHIVAGSIVAEDIKAYSLTVDRLSVGAVNNLVADPQFGDSDLSNARRIAGNVNSNANLTWNVFPTVNNFWVNATAAIGSVTQIARIPMINNTVFTPTGISTPTNIPSIGLVAAVAKNTGPSASVAGQIKARVSFWVSQGSGTWPGTALITIRGYFSAYKRDGTAIPGTFQIIPSAFYTGSTGLVTIESTTGTVLPDETAGIIPYFFVSMANVTANTQVTFYSPEVWQENSIYIGDGMIKTPLLSADAVTADKIIANALTVKHVITGSFFQTAAPGSGLPRVVIGPNANYLGQAGMQIYPASGDSNKSANLFVADSAGTGSWEPGQFAIVGPENVRNSSGRADITLAIGGDFTLFKQYVDNNGRFSGIEGRDGTNEMGLYGTFPRGDVLGDAWTMIRVLGIGFQNGSVTWGVNNGWSYRPNGASNATSSTVPMYTSVYTFSPSGFGWVSSGSVDNIQFICWRGAYDI